MMVLVVEYDGTRYHGFQLQTIAPTIQGEIEKALDQLTGERIRIVGASRTDAGVHAKGQIIGFKTRSVFPPKTFITGLNHYLPEDIAIRAAYQKADDFHLRRESRSREYRYLILNRSTVSPLERARAFLITTPLDVDAMNKACRLLIGKHDFASFTQRGNVKNTVRTIYKAEIYREGEFVTFNIEGDSFLQQQVRRTVGALIKVGTGKINLNAFRELITLKTNGLAGPTAPPHGLCLMAVNY